MMSVKSKNIHVLSTNGKKASYLAFDRNRKLRFSEWSHPYASVGGWIALNIYITSDEEIKDGDWMIRPNEQPIKVTKDFFWDFGVRYYKIILTTDQDLIKDGVQVIDDEFLEWFVKNPSCEEVETFKVWRSDDSYSYEIIIPKEEPKQHVEFINNNIDQLDKAIESFKQETLEEAAEKWISTYGFDSRKMNSKGIYKLEL